VASTEAGSPLPPSSARGSALERDVGALEAGRVDVREVVREDALALFGAADGDLERRCGDVEQAHSKLLGG
jgi:hypothetical protein